MKRVFVREVLTTSTVGLPARSVTTPRVRPTVVVRNPRTLSLVYVTIHVGGIVGAHVFGLAMMVTTAAHQGLRPLAVALPAAAAWLAFLCLFIGALVFAWQGAVEVSVEGTLLVARTQIARWTVRTRHALVRDVVATTWRSMRGRHGTSTVVVGLATPRALVRVWQSSDEACMEQVRDELAALIATARRGPTARDAVRHP
jgi:hypothetical protein